MSARRPAKELSRWRTTLKWAAVAVIFFFLGRTVWQGWAQVRAYSFHFRPGLFAGATAVYASSYFWIVAAWHVTTKRLGVGLSLPDSAAGWFYSQLGKYVPGKIWLLAGRLLYYERRGQPKELVSVALYLETATVLLAAGILSLFAVAPYAKAAHASPGVQAAWLGGAVGAGLLAIHPRILASCLNWLLPRLGREPLVLPIAYRTVLSVLLLCSGGWLVAGIGFCLLVESLFAVGPGHFLFLTGALSLSNIAGIAAFFAPSGLGVREGALVYLLSTLVPGPIAVVVAVVSRLWVTVIELLLIGAVHLSVRLRRGS